jgi:hypothetical protein
MPPRHGVAPAFLSVPGPAAPVGCSTRVGVPWTHGVLFAYGIDCLGGFLMRREGRCFYEQQSH